MIVVLITSFILVLALWMKRTEICELVHINEIIYLTFTMFVSFIYFGALGFWLYSLIINRILYY